jgi:hypothetical protein
MEKYKELLKNAYIALVVSYTGKSLSEKIFVAILGCAAYTAVTLSFIMIISILFM